MIRSGSLRASAQECERERPGILRAKIEGEMSAITAVILAAGEATRMRSKLPKALHQLCGRRMIDYPITTVAALGARVVVVVGRNADQVSDAVKTLAPDATFVEQKERLGTGHADRKSTRLNSSH